MKEAVCDLPWRIHWNMKESSIGHIQEAIRECCPLVMTVEVDDPRWLEPLGLPWPNTAIVAVLNGWRDFEGALSTAGIVRWEFPVKGPAEAARVAGRFFPVLPPARAAFRWIPSKGAIKDLGPMLDLCIREGCGLTLPNRPADGITAGEEDLFPDTSEVALEKDPPLPVHRGVPDFLPFSSCRILHPYRNRYKNR